MPAVSAAPIKTAAVMSPAKSPAIVVSMLAMMTGARISAAPKPAAITKFVGVEVTRLKLNFQSETLYVVSYRFRLAESAHY